MTKAALRKKYQSLRNDLNPEQIEELSLDIANQSLKLPIWNKTYYHLYLPIIHKKEVNTEYILQILQGKDKEVVLSKSDFENNKMIHFLLTENTTIKTNVWGIPEPMNGLEVPVHQIQVVFIPLLTFDTTGQRVGYGKGFYDQFLAQCSPETLKIGLSFFEHENKIEDILPTDIPLDYCITPTQTYRF